jgi:hypothetical protein
MAKYVAYTNGLGVEPGEPIGPEAFADEEGLWEYHVARGNVVRQGGEHDPKVLAARAAGEDYEDPRDQRIAELERELLRLQGRPGTPPPGAFQENNARDEVDEDPEDEEDGSAAAPSSDPEKKPTE